MIETILKHIDRNSTAVNIFHLVAQLVVFSAKSRARYSLVHSCGWQKKTDTLVVVGGGPTVNELSVEDWNRLSTYDIMGLSYGSLSPAKVDAFVCEFAPPAAQQNQIAMFQALSKRYAQSLHRPLCLWKHPERVTNIEHLSLPVSRVLTLVIPALSLSAIRKVTGLITRLKLHKLFMFQSSGSVSALVMFARAFNYRRIIFVGVDLKDRRYFFDDNPDYAHIGLENPFRMDGQPDLTKTHQVASSFGDIEDFAKRLEVAAGPLITLEVTSPSSALSDYWPLYER